MARIKKLPQSLKQRMIKKQEIRKITPNPMKKIIKRIQRGSRKNKQPKSPLMIKSSWLQSLWLKERNSTR